MRPWRRRMLPVGGVVVLATAAAALAGTGAHGTVDRRSAAQTVAQVRVHQSRPGELYFLRYPDRGNTEYIMRVPASGNAPQRVVKIVKAEVLGMAIARQRLYWLQSGETKGRSIRYIELSGARRIHVLVRKTGTAISEFVGAGGWLYWTTQLGIGRVRPDGAQLTRHFLRKIDASMGFATDGHHLYFSNGSSQIGRVALNGHDLDRSFIRLPKSAVPEGLAVGHGYLYWTEGGLGSPSYIGRATLRGTRAGDHWLNLHQLAGPFELAAGDNWLYFDWEIGAGPVPPMDVGRARANGTSVQRRFLAGSGPFLLTAPGANS